MRDKEQTAGERCVSDRLFYLDPSNSSYKVIDDVLLPSQGHTETTQIDHVVISKFGIFCIETKSYKGSVYGNSHEKTWNHYLFGSRYDFYNPIFQNYCHVRALHALLHPHFQGVPIFSIIVFPFAYKVKISDPRDITTLDNLLPMIRSINTEFLSDTELAQIEQLLDGANLSAAQSHEKHIETVQKYIQEGNLTVKFKKAASYEPADETYKTRIISVKSIPITGIMNICVECKLEYLFEDAVKEKWHLYQGHCKKCGQGKNVLQ